MRYYFLFAILIFSWASTAQVRTIYGRIIDKDTRMGIPYSVVQSKERSDGTYSNENGAFVFKVNTDSVNTLIFYCIGYGKKELTIPGTADSVIVELQQVTTHLPEVVITPSEEKHRKTYILGKDDLLPGGYYHATFGQECAIFLESNGAPHKYLKEVFLYFTGNGKPGLPFRLHVYGIDTGRFYPGPDLTDSNTILFANKGNEWVSVDLSSKKIPLGKGLFISVEWLTHHGDDALHKLGLVMGNLDYTRLEKDCPTLGATAGYNKQGSLLYDRSLLIDRGWRDVSNMANPMIYCTYNRIR